MFTFQIHLATQRHIQFLCGSVWAPLPIRRTRRSRCIVYHLRSIEQLALPIPLKFRFLIRRRFSSQPFAASILACSSTSTRSMIRLTPSASSRKYAFCCIRTMRLRKITQVFAITTKLSNSHDLICLLSNWNCHFMTPNNLSTSFRAASWLKLSGSHSRSSHFLLVL